MAKRFMLVIKISSTAYYDVETEEEYECPLDVYQAALDGKISLPDPITEDVDEEQFIRGFKHPLLPKEVVCTKVAHGEIHPN